MYKNTQEIINAIVRSISNASQAAYAEARATCPIQTGDLYNSISVQATSTGFTMTATMPYATDVEDGHAGQIISGNYRTTRKRHTRTSKNGVTSKVRAHKVNYSGSRPVQVGTKWATLTSVNAREGTHFMKNACKKAAQEAVKQVTKK